MSRFKTFISTSLLSKLFETVLEMKLKGLMKKEIKNSENFKDMNEYEKAISNAEYQLSLPHVFTDNQLTEQSIVIFKDIFVDLDYAHDTCEEYTQKLIEINGRCNKLEMSSQDKMTEVKIIMDEMTNIYLLVDNMVEKGYLLDFYNILAVRGPFLDMQYMNKALQSGVSKKTFKDNKLISNCKDLILEINKLAISRDLNSELITDENQNNIEQIKERSVINGTLISRDQEIEEQKTPAKVIKLKDFKKHR